MRGVLHPPLGEIMNQTRGFLCRDSLRVSRKMRFSPQSVSPGIFAGRAAPTPSPAVGMAPWAPWL